MKSYYQILGVAETATEAEIKKVFRKLARETHPDTHPGNVAAEARFKEVSEAYETLGDPIKRKQYDHERKNPHRGRPGKGGPAPKNPFAYGINVDDMFSGLFTEEKPKAKPNEATEKNEKNPLNADALFSKFMGFKPKGG